jgi:hypothetical protein
MDNGLKKHIRLLFLEPYKTYLLTKYTQPHGISSRSAPPDVSIPPHVQTMNCSENSLELSEWREGWWWWWWFMSKGHVFITRHYYYAGFTNKTSWELPLVGPTEMCRRNNAFQLYGWHKGGILKQNKTENGCLLGCCAEQSGQSSSPWLWRQQGPLKRR